MHVYPKKRKLPLNKPLRILLATSSLILLAGATLGPIYALFVEEIGGSLLDASFAGGVFAVAAGITTLLSGRFVDKVTQQELIVVAGYAAMGVGYLLYIFVGSIWSLLLIQVVIGFGEAIYSPAFDALYSKHLDAHKEGLEWGSWESMYYFTTAAGALLGGLIVNQFGFRLLFLIMSALSFLSAVYIYRLPRREL